ncbi:MAG TPA: bifunctional diguanylate cyclase/phosphodiesterase [Allosphingosinicella sp.]|nr:bifunctional diguanylate cyclase/phosphodiesterase [Allosphingosinicella sp.]
MKWAKLHKISNWLLSFLAGLSSFILTLLALLMLRELPEKILAALTMGAFALLIVWIACERPNSAQGGAVSALIKRLLAVASGDFTSPAPSALKKEMPALASAVDSLFEQVRSSIENVQAMAMFDPVTSLPNRLHFKREGERILASHEEGKDAALLFIDLDGFKEVNDNLGHAQGDQVLALVAGRLREVVQAEAKPESAAHPIVARLSGDEFTLLFPAVASADDARRIAGAALSALSEPFHAGGQTVQIGASVGVALWPSHAADLASLMKAADVAMYHAKGNGRSQVCLYDETLAVAFARKAETERALREAVVGDEFSLVYQPQVCARSGVAVAGEALLRWRRPGAGLVMPAEFIPIAEESSLIVAIGEWVVDAVVEALGRWRDAGMTQRLTFNVSPGQFERPGFFARLREKMQRTGSPPWLLELEFTETMAMRCSDSVLAEFAALRADGVTLAIDDFGSGYSNFARMKDMPIDRVKLDASLTADIDASESSRTIVAAVIHLIHGLGMEVVAEGVERKEQIDVLRAIGCDVFQGHVFAEAMTEAELFEWIAGRGEAGLPRSA